MRPASSAGDGRTSAGLHAPALRRRPLPAKPRSAPRGRTLSARYPGSGEVAVAGDQERDHEVEPDPRPGLPPGAAGCDLRSLVDRGQHATDHRGYRNARAHSGPMGDSRAASPGLDQGGHRLPEAAGVARDLIAGPPGRSMAAFMKTFRFITRSQSVRLLTGLKRGA